MDDMGTHENEFEVHIEMAPLGVSRIHYALQRSLECLISASAILTSGPE
jgi:hypothetical protein